MQAGAPPGPCSTYVPFRPGLISAQGLKQGWVKSRLLGSWTIFPAKIRPGLICGLALLARSGPACSRAWIRS
jgi:hypothetical protein